MKELEDNSVDAIVTDPPYGLVSIQKRFGKKGSAPAKYGKDGSFSRLSGGFMGKKWDGSGIEYSVDMWSEALRVLKPGGYLLAFGGTRTCHRMTTAIEDAGFEIRDMIAWVYGSGFPKSLNIGKAVDKLQGNERKVTETYKVPDIKGDAYGTMNDKQGGSYKNIEVNKTKGTSEWEGWGTALKPALEPITVARKPLSEKTVAKNCLKWGTGGINIDGCRVGTEDNLNGGGYSSNTEKMVNEVYGEYNKMGDTYKQLQGRFPANLIHSGEKEVVDMFPNDSARFFYQPKASKKERNAGCEGTEEKQKIFNGQSNKPSSDMKGVEQKFTTQPAKNFHPTVKPIALMEYLVKLVSREEAVVLDPFMGSGSTGIACANLNRNFIGIEMDADYIKIAEARIDYAKNKPKQDKLI